MDQDMWESSEAEPNKRQPCALFLRGLCKDGTKCRKIHDRATYRALHHPEESAASGSASVAAGQPHAFGGMMDEGRSGSEGQFMWEENSEPEVTLHSIAEAPRRRKGTRASRALQYQEAHPRGMSLEDLPQERWKKVEVPVKGYNYRTTVEVIGPSKSSWTLAPVPTRSPRNWSSTFSEFRKSGASIPSVRSAQCSSKGGARETM